ncbi:MAG: hypothetical protein A3F40_02690 [Chlamydiae bacterium RIFCSPHIGHO2_12_FULL_27_8]|nr:MAG: hypothetical protein A3F40_02690 [Chlamydiae bacterium RIFCSPHIGHO2_12_FULL_27_8]OGN66457.1 MAG: hypothetical protein A2888_02330 [Chlamydiae bacterium RIFCSPLOWO2_01_FULL_28_7]
MTLPICYSCGQTLLAVNVSIYGLHENCFKECFGSCDDFVDIIARSQSVPPRPESQVRKNISFFMERTASILQN